MSDDSFAGIHRLALFDWLLLVPYFTLLTILAIYGAHRFVMVYRYLRSRQRVPKVPPQRFDRAAASDHSIGRCSTSATWWTS